MRRLLPGPQADLSVHEAYTVPRPRPSERPWVGLCMVASIDGAAALDGRSGGLSSPTDALVLHTLREAADMIVVGAGTAQAEGYGPPRKAGQRIGVVTASGRVDPDLPVFASGAGFLITTETAPAHGLDAVRAGRDRVDLVAALAMLDVDYVQAEGGPTFNGTLFEHDLVDEVDLTVAPTLVGGDAPRLAAGASEALRRMHLAQVCADDGFVFLRYLRAR